MTRDFHKHMMPKLRRTVVMLGLGRIQLGLIGPAFRSLGYDLVGVNLGSGEIVESLRRHGYYMVVTDPPAAGEIVEVSEVYRFDKTSPNDEGSMSSLIACAQASIINVGTGTTEAAIEATAHFLLEVVRYRRSNAIVEPLFITCSDSPVGLRFAIDLIRCKMQSGSYGLTDQERIAIWNDVSSHVFFCHTLADRICSLRIVPPDDRPVKIISEAYGELAVTRAFLGARPLEPETRFSNGGLFVTDNLEHMRMRKVFTLSMAHSIAAYLGWFAPKRPKTISEALELPEVRSYTEAALEDVASALAVVSGRSLPSWNEYASKVLARISSTKLRDPIPRVAHDVPRKLMRDDRLIGPLLLVLRVSWKVSEPIMTGILYALLYAHETCRGEVSFEDDVTTRRLGEQLRHHGVRFVLTTVCGLDINDATEEGIVDLLEERFMGVLGTDGAPS